MKRYKVYCLRDKERKIVYVGQTRQPLAKRLISHKASGRLPHKEITIELIADFDIPEPMYQLEAMLIEHYDLVDHGWNKEYGKVKVPKQVSQAGENNQFYRHSHRKEIRDAIGKRSLGNKYAQGNPSRRGMKNSPEHQEKIVQALRKPVVCKETGEVFESIKQAAERMNLHHTKISSVCKGSRKTTGGFSFYYLDKWAVD